MLIPAEDFPMKFKVFFKILPALLLMAAVTGCASSNPNQNYAKIWYEFEPFRAHEWKNKAEGISIAASALLEVPDEFSQSMPMCTETGLSDPEEREVVGFLPPGSLVFKASITNHSDHVIRIPLAVASLLDPNDAQFDALSRDDIRSRFALRDPCHAKSPDVAFTIDQLNLISRDRELLPNRTTTGYVAFLPRDNRLPGVWTLAFYDMPLSTDATGMTLKTAHLDMRVRLRKHADIFTKLSGEEEYVVRSRDLTFAPSVEDAISKVTAERESERAAAEKAEANREAEAKRREAERGNTGYLNKPFGDFFKGLLQPPPAEK